MAENKPDRDALERRRAEILAQLERVNTEQRLELDHDPEEQAIQVEHGEVATAREQGLRRELAAIEDMLFED